MLQHTERKGACCLFHDANGRCTVFINKWVKPGVSRAGLRASGDTEESFQSPGPVTGAPKGSEYF